MNIVITESASLKIAEVLASGPADHYLRIFVQGGGCAGFSYGFVIDDLLDDSLVSGSVRVDVISAQYLEGATIDYVEELMWSSFKVRDLVEFGSCGCGSSFRVQ